MEKVLIIVGDATETVDTLYPFLRVNAQCAPAVRVARRVDLVGGFTGKGHARARIEPARPIRRHGQADRAAVGDRARRVFRLDGQVRQRGRGREVERLARPRRKRDHRPRIPGSPY